MLVQENISIKNLARLIKKIIGYNGEIKFNSLYPDGTKRKDLNSNRIKILGWKPKIKLEQGIKKILDQKKNLKMNNILDFFLEINLNEKHKKITNDQKIFFIGGFLLLLGILFTSTEPEFKFLCSAVYLIGISSDKKYLSSPNVRLLLQTILILFSLYLLDLKIIETKN